MTRHHPPYDPDSSIAWENFVVAQAAQAMLGLLSADVSDVACRIDSDSVQLHFVASGDVVEDVSEIRFELDVLLDGAIAIETEIHEGSSSLDWSDPTLRGLYSAKPSEPGQDY